MMRQPACLVFNPIMVESYAALFSCPAVIQGKKELITRYRLAVSVWSGFLSLCVLRTGYVFCDLVTHPWPFIYIDVSSISSS